MNLILLFPEDFSAMTHVSLTGRRLAHVLDVHRAGIGDELRIGLAGGMIGAGKVLSLDRGRLEMEVRLEHTPPPALPVTLLLALPRPKVLRRVLRSASSLGVKRIYLFNCHRVEKSFWQSPFLDEAAVREQLILGLEQARDTIIPDVQLRQRFKPFVEDELPGILAGTLPLVAHPGAAAPLPRDVKGPATLVIGPEGGFIPYEIDKLVNCGCTAVEWGQRILSVETAVPALIARLF